MNKWVSVKDRLPDEKHSEIQHDFEYVLCATTFGDVRAYKFGTLIGWKNRISGTNAKGWINMLLIGCQCRKCQRKVGEFDV